jgi:hypothetical protein
VRIVCVLILLGAVWAGCPPPAQVITAKDLAIRRPNATALVVVHSRSGYTTKVGLTVSRMLKTDYIRLVVPKGAGDSYFKTPNRHDRVKYRPAHVDLSRYNLVFLGSPIWWYYATAFIYRFIKKHDLTGKRVVLFYTYHGGIRKAAVPEWKRLVASRGGKVVGVIAVNRKKLKGQSVSGFTARIVAARKHAWVGQQGSPPKAHPSEGKKK